MTKTKKVVSRLVGGIQCGLGGIAAVLAYLVYASPTIRDTLSVTSEEVYLYMFLFLVFGMFSIISGLFLAHEENSGN